MSSRILLCLAFLLGAASQSSAQPAFRNLQNFGGEFSFEVAATFTVSTPNGAERIIVAGNNDSQGLRFFSNRTSSGTQSEAFIEKTAAITVSPLAANVTNLIAEDLNGDGFSDLIFRTKNPSGGVNAPGLIGYSLYDSNQGKFLSQTMLTVIDAGIPVLADINNDGRSDIVFAERSTAGTGAGAASINAYTQNIGGTFTAQTLSALGTSFLPTEILLGIGDYDTDGDKDVLFVQYQAVGFGFDAYIRYLENNGSGYTNQYIGTLPSIRVEKFIVTDIDNNGNLDASLVLSNSSLFTGTYGVVSYHKQGGSWIYQVLVPSQAIGLPSARAMEVGDYNADGRKDFIFAGEYDPISIFSQSASGAFTNVSNAALPGFSGLESQRAGSIFRIAPPLLVADFNADSALDIVLPRATQNGVFLAGNGSTFFDATTTLGFSNQIGVPQPESIKSVCLGKLTPSRTVDAVLVTQTAILQSASNGAGRFTAAGPITAPLSGITASDCVLTDFDGDLDDDLILAASPNDLILINNGAGTFTQSSATLPSTSKKIATADFNSDSRTDLFLADTSAAIVLNNTAGFITIPVSVTPGFSVIKAEVADVDGIAGQELVMLERDSTGNGNAVVVTINLQTQTSQRAIVLPSSRDFSLGDFNSDGVSDILIIPTAGTQPFVVSSTGGFNPLINFSNAKISAATDMTGDGTTDIILMNDTGAALFINNGVGVFQQTAFDSGLKKPVSLDTMDLDLDGDIDLVVSAETVRGLRPRFIANLSSQFQISSYARVGATAGSQIIGVLDSAVPAIGFVFASLDPLSAPLTTPWGNLRLTNFVSGPSFFITTGGTPMTFNFSLPYFPSLVGSQMTVQAAFLDLAGGLKLGTAGEIKLVQ